MVWTRETQAEIKKLLRPIGKWGPKRKWVESKGVYRRWMTGVPQEDQTLKLLIIKLWADGYDIGKYDRELLKYCRSDGMTYYPQEKPPGGRSISEHKYVSEDYLNNIAPEKTLIKKRHRQGSDARATKRVKLVLEAAAKGEPVDSNKPEILAQVPQPESYVNPQDPDFLFHAYPEMNHDHAYKQTDLPSELEEYNSAHGTGIKNDGKVLPRQEWHDSVRVTTLLLQLCY